MSVSKKRIWKIEPGRETEMPLQFKVEVRKENLSWVHNLEMELLSEVPKGSVYHKCSVSISSCLASHHHVPPRLVSVATLPWSQDQPAHLVLLSPPCPLVERNLGLAFCWEPVPVPWCWWSALGLLRNLVSICGGEPPSMEVQGLGAAPPLPAERWANADPCLIFTHWIIRNNKGTFPLKLRKAFSKLAQV